MTRFDHLSVQEQQSLFDAIPLITILVAGADGEIDEKEAASAEKLTHIRTFDERSEEVHDYYEQIDDMVESRINSYLKILSKTPLERKAEISTELAKLNPILAKLETTYAAALYQSFLSFAKHIARASGGFFRFLTIGPKEDKVIDLEMIIPVEIA
ncbi:MAG: hypothetical protein AAF849_16560 [Bacteroidota bacterium]